MTTTGPPSVPPDAPTTTVFRRAATAEWTRLWTLRSTWWSLLAGAALMLFIGAALGAGDPGGPAPVWKAAEFAILPGQFAFLLVVVLAVAGEYATGAIRSSLQWVPRRGILLAARTLVPVAFVTACAVAVSAAADLTAWALLGPDAEVVAGDIARSLGTIALVVAAGGVLTVGVGLLLRSTAGALVAIFLLMLVLPIVFPQFGVPWLTAVGEHLPGHAAVSLLHPSEFDLPASRAVTVLMAWTTVLMFSGGWSLVRRDTT